MVLPDISYQQALAEAVIHDVKAKPRSSPRKGKMAKVGNIFFRCATHLRMLMIAGNSLLRKTPKSTHSSLKHEQLL